MPAIKLLNIFALSTLAVLLCSFAPSQTLALSVRSNHMARNLPNHHGISKKKRGNKRCRPRSSNLPVSSTSGPKPTNTPKDDDPKPTSSSSSPPDPVETKPPTNTPSGPGKLAIAWAMGNDKRFALIIAAKRVKMVHLWTAQIPDIVKASGIPVSIMLWGTSQDKIDNFVKYAKPGYASHAFGFNEVNEQSQAATDPDTAVSVWYKYLRPLANQGYTLGSPVTTSNPNGFPWMTEFFKKCGGDCHVDEVPIHFYDVKFEDLKAYINKWAGFGKPLRLTEFACQNFNDGPQPSMDEVWSFTEQAIKFMEGDDRVLSYAPFGFMDDMYNVANTNRLFSGDGLTDLGWRYANGK
jgi:hypothetical protein